MRLTSPWPAALLLGGLLAALPAAAELTAQEQRGKAIYFEGESPAGAEITAVLGDTGTEVPASVMPCSGCHGRDGRGRPEGGVYPSNLTWPALTKTYGVEHPGGRKHPPYTEQSLKLAIAMGTDPAGNRLHVAMPRYRLSHQDMGDLIAYVRRLGEDLDPGLSDDAIALATLLPREGPMASLGAAMEAVLRAYFDDVNQKGGIYHRTIELEVASAPENAAARAAALRQLLEDDEVFALVGAFLPGAEEELTGVVKELEIPLVGPFTLYPQIDFFDFNPYVFYLLPGLEDLGRALVSFAAGLDGASLRAAVVTGAGTPHESTAQAISEKAAELGWPEVRLATAGPEGIGAESLACQEVDAVFLLVSGSEQAAFLREAAVLGWYPRVFLPGSFLDRALFEAPRGFAERLFLAFPTLPSNQDPRSVRTYRELVDRYNLPARHLTAQIAALSSARVLVEGLKLAGRDLSRGRLIEVLEGFVDFDTGLVPPVTYSPNRRVGVQGAYVLALDLEKQTLVPASGWVGAH